MLPSRTRFITLACVLVVAHALVLGFFQHTPLQSHLSEMIQTTLDALCVLACMRASRRSQRFARWFWRSCPLSLANCYFAYDSSGFQPYVTMLHCVENCWMEFLRTTGGKLQVTLFQLV